MSFEPLPHFALDPKVMHFELKRLGVPLLNINHACAARVNATITEDSGGFHQITRNVGGLPTSPKGPPTWLVIVAVGVAVTLGTAVVFAIVNVFNL